MLNSSELIHKLKPVEINRLRDLGDIFQYAIPWAALLWVALDGDQAAAWRWFYIGVVNTVLTQVFKQLFNFTQYGKRPDGGDDAMPSGHTSSAFMGAFFFYFQYGLNAAIAPLIFATITGYSRIFAKRHWPRDVIAGALLALTINYLYFHHLPSNPLF